MTVAIEHCSYRRHRLNGFTLVEVMVALTILSLVLVGTISALRTFGNTQAALERTAARVDEIRSVSTFLRDLLDSAVATKNSDFTLGGGSEETGYFRAGTDFLEFETNILFGERYGGSHLVRVAREDNRLVLRWQERPRDGFSHDWQGKPSRVIAEQVEKFVVATREDYAKEWVNERRTGDTNVPALVRLEVKAAGRYWPVLILRAR